MCGICGFVGVDLFGEIDRMTDLMVHRGPDDRGVFRSRTDLVGLGHRRLSIIDIEGGKQPMTNEKARRSGEARQPNRSSLSTTSQPRPVTTSVKAMTKRMAVMG